MKKQNWNLIVFILSFSLALLFSFLTNKLSYNASNLIMILLILLVIAIGIIFDMIGVAVLTAKESTFHAMSSKKIKGAKIATKLIRNNVRVASFCNDIIGDICGIVSGSAGAIIATSLSANFGFNSFITVLVVTGFISALTIGGKAFGKSIAVNKSNYILYEFAKVVTDLSFRKK